MHIVQVSLTKMHQYAWIISTSFKGQRGFASSYITEDSDYICSKLPSELIQHPLISCPQVRSRLLTKGEPVFAPEVPRLWDSLPDVIRLANTLAAFQSLLTTYFYRKPSTDAPIIFL